MPLGGRLGQWPGQVGASAHRHQLAAPSHAPQFSVGESESQ
jgi:hypothetical protein